VTCQAARRLRRRLAHRFVLVGVLVLVAGCGSGHGDGDPGGRILAGLKTIERALPAHARVILREADEPQWDSCDGRSGTFGWDPVSVHVEFRSRERPRALVAHAERVLRAAGWRREASRPTSRGPALRWSRARSSTADLTSTRTPHGRQWELDAEAPPKGPSVSGC
jgi:hypothetical protein